MHNVPLKRIGRSGGRGRTRYSPLDPARDAVLLISLVAVINSKTQKFWEDHARRRGFRNFCWTSRNHKEILLCPRRFYKTIGKRAPYQKSSLVGRPYLSLISRRTSVARVVLWRHLEAMS